MIYQVFYLYGWVGSQLHHECKQQKAHLSLFVRAKLPIEKQLKMEAKCPVFFPGKHRLCQKQADLSQHKDELGSFKTQKHRKIPSVNFKKKHSVGPLPLGLYLFQVQ